MLRRKARGDEAANGGRTSSSKAGDDPPGLPPQRGGGVATPAFSDVTWFAPFVVCWAYLRASRCVGRRLTEVGLGC